MFSDKIYRLASTHALQRTNDDRRQIDTSNQRPDLNVRPKLNRKVVAGKCNWSLLYSFGATAGI